MEMIKKVAQRRASGTAARTNRKSIKTNPKPIGKIQAKKRIDPPKSIDNIDDVFGQSKVEKEEKLVNLMVKVLVKSTLDELYGKESD